MPKQYLGQIDTVQVVDAQGRKFKTRLMTVGMASPPGSATAGPQQASEDADPPSEGGTLNSD